MLPKNTGRCESQPALKQQGYSPRPVKDFCIPLFDHRASMDQVDDERKRVHQGKNETGVRDPAVEDLHICEPLTCRP